MSEPHETELSIAFHLIGALSELGKLGMVCIGDCAKAADQLFSRRVEVLDRQS